MSIESRANGAAPGAGEERADGPPLRIGLIAPPWLPVPPVAYGGTETVLDSLVRGLLAAGHEPVLFTTGDSSCPIERRSVIEEAPGVDVGGPPVEVHHVLAAYRSLTDVDLIHDHSSVGPLVALTGAARPTVTTNHNPFVAPFSSVYQAVSEQVPVIAISRHHAASASGVRIEAVIHHGLDVEEFPVGDGSGGYLLFLGRMSPEKGAHRAIAIARSSGMPIVLAGKQHSRAERDYFDQVIRPLLGAGAEYVGEVSRGPKLELLAGAKALLNPIEWSEPFGMVMIEALACGTPVLAFGHGAAPEIVEEGVTGFLANDVATLAEAVAELDSIDRARCRAAVAGHFSVGRMVAEHVALYRGVLERSGARRG